MKKIKIQPFDVLNIKGLNTLTLHGTFNVFDEADAFDVQVTLTREGDGMPLPAMTSDVMIRTSVSVPRKLAGDIEGIFDLVLNELPGTERAGK